MKLPPFAPFPPAHLQKIIVPEEWQACLGSWILLARSNLLLPSIEFSSNVLKESSLVEFLLSYIREISASDTDLASQAPNAKSLRRECFLLLHRILTEIRPASPALVEWTSLGNISIVYAKNESLRSVLLSLWDREDLNHNKSMQESKSHFIRLLEDKNNENFPADLDLVLRQATALLEACYQYGQFLLLGSDFLDALSTAFEEGSALFQKRSAALGYWCLKSLLDPRRPKVSTLLDHLYSLNAASHYDSLLKGICSTTPLLKIMRDRLSGPESERAKPLISQLSGFERFKNGKPKKLISRKIDKGKGKDQDEYGDGAFGNVHVHKLSLVTQIQDLFPDLGSGFIIKLLDEYDNDTERVTAHLLDDSLPPHLNHLDRSEDINHVPSAQPSPSHPAQNIPTRHNIFDNDAFDRLAIDPSSLTLGRANPSLTADTILSARPPTAKAAILSALAAFDSDSDERDDTYDIEDVGGTVDAALPGTDERDGDLRDGNEEALFSAWTISPAVFARDAATRRSPARTALKSETSMTDEALEGWAMMIARDPRRLRRLEAKFSLAAGTTQRELPATSYRAAEEDSDPGAAASAGRGRGRGRGRGGRGRGIGRPGDAAGPAGERDTQVARQRKDAGKASRANHNRRDQRARKMARGGFSG